MAPDIRETESSVIFKSFGCLGLRLVRERRRCIQDSCIFSFSNVLYLIIPTKCFIPKGMGEYNYNRLVYKIDKLWSVRTNSMLKGRAPT